MPCFEETFQYECANTELYVVVNAAQGALERMHGAAETLVSRHPDWSAIQLREELFPGLALRGVNISVRESFIDRTCQENWDALAKFVLSTVIARFEAWLEVMAQRFPLKLRQISGTPLETALQFPAKGDFGRKKPGAREVLNHLRATEDADLRSSLRPALHRTRRTDVRQLRPLLRVYRVYKEVRNSLMHAGGRATPYLASVSAGVPTYRASTLALKTPPAMPVYRPGDAVTLTVRDAVLFDALVTRIVRTLDAELSSSYVGHDVVFDRAEAFAREKSLEVLPRDPTKRARRVTRLMRFAGEAGPLNVRRLSPSAVEVARFERFLRRNRVAG
jgi:hypothetical protein